VTSTEELIAVEEELMTEVEDNIRKAVVMEPIVNLL